ncbi:hypothetical protein H0H92_011110 [Tricholoma furcatifolium]|nr:hypothetical protein H0H92_011110 [Tricholoma furcatifolium]
MQSQHKKPSMMNKVKEKVGSMPNIKQLFRPRASRGPSSASSFANIAINKGIAAPNVPSAVIEASNASIAPVAPGGPGALLAMPISEDLLIVLGSRQKLIIRLQVRHLSQEMQDWILIPLLMQQVEEVLGTAWHGFTMLLGKVEGLLGGTPFQTPVAAVNVLIQLGKAVNGNKDSLGEQMDRLETRLKIVESALIGDTDEVSMKMKEDFARYLIKQVVNLHMMSHQKLWKAILENEENKNKLQNIIQDIDEYTKNFHLQVVLNIERNTSDIFQQIHQLQMATWPRSRRAIYNADLEDGQGPSRGPCTPGTRLSVLDHIYKWAQDTSSESPNVFWLTGPAGSGKSTIAYSVAQHFGEATNDIPNILQATFFASQKYNDTRHRRFIIPSIVYQLAHHSKSYAHALLQANMFDSVDIPSKQMNDLLVNPWEISAYERSSDLPPCLVVVDALDEIDGKGGSEFLEDLLKAVNNGSFKAFKFLVTSRPDPDLAKLSGGHDKSVRVWNASTGKQVWQLQGHTGWIRSVAFSHDGTQIVSGSDDQTARVWDASTGKQFQKLQGHASISSVAFSPDGTQIVSGSLDNSVRVWDVSTGKQIQILQGHSRSVKSVAFSADGTRIGSGSYDQTVRVWVASTGKQVQQLQGHTNGVMSVAFSSDGTQIVSGSLDNSVRVWDASNGKQIQKLQGHASSVNSVAFSPDGTTIVLWDASTGKQIQMLQDHAGPVKSVAFSPDGTQIVSGSYDKSARIWDSSTGKQIEDLQGHTGFINCVAFAPNGTQIVSGSYDQTVRVWDASTGKQVQQLHGHTGEVNSVAFSPDGTQIVSGSYDRSVRVWDASTEKQVKGLQGHTSLVHSVAFSPDGTQIVSGSYDQSVRVWNASTRKQVKKLHGHTNQVSSVAFSPDGTKIVSGSYDKSVRVWDASTGKQVKKLQGHTSLVNSVAFSPDGSHIVSGSDDQTVRVWDASTGRRVQDLQGHTDEVMSVAFSPDGTQIVSGSLDNSVRVWDVWNGKQIQKLQGHASAVTSVAFSPDGTQIVSGSWDQTVRVWNASTKKQDQEFRLLLFKLDFSI